METLGNKKGHKNGTRKEQTLHAITWQLEELAAEGECLVNDLTRLDATYQRRFPKPPMNEGDQQKESLIRSLIGQKHHALANLGRAYAALSAAFFYRGGAQGSEGRVRAERIRAFQDSFLSIETEIARRHPPKSA